MGSLYHMIGSTFGLRLLLLPRMQRAALLTLAGAVGTFRLYQLWTFANAPRWAEDLSYYWTAGLRVVDGEPVYSLAQTTGPYVPEGQLGLLYPPPFAAAFSTFALVFPRDFRALSWVWFALGLVVLIASVIVVVRTQGLNHRFPILGPHATAWFVVAALFLPPVLGELAVGNVHIEVLGLLSLAWVGLARGDRNGERVAGLSIGIAALIKAFPALLILWFLATRRWTAAVWALAGAVAISIIALPVTGLDAWLQYPAVLANMGEIRSTGDAVSPTVWLAPALGFAMSRLVVMASAIALTLWAARSRELATSFGIAVAVSLLASPAVFHHYLTILILPLLLALSSGVRSVVVLAVYLLLWGGQQPLLGSVAWILSRVPQTLAWAILLATLLRRTIRRTPAREVAVAPAVA